MQFDNIRVSRKLWGAFLGLMIGMLLLSSFAQNRGNNSMTAAMDGIIEIEERISSAVRWRGATETAVTMVMGGAVTTDSVLAEQYGAKVKEIIGNINKVQEKIVASATAPEEKAALDKVLDARKAVLAATAKTWELKGAGDAVATQRFADDEFAPLVTKYLKTQDDFVATLEKRRDAIRADAVSRHRQRRHRVAAAQAELLRARVLDEVDHAAAALAARRRLAQPLASITRSCPGDRVPSANTRWRWPCSTVLEVTSREVSTAMPSAPTASNSTWNRLARWMPIPKAPGSPSAA